MKLAPPRLLPAVVVLLTLLLRPGASSAQTDYLPDNSAWNGTSELANLATGLQLPIQLATRLDYDELDDKTVLILLYPRSEIDARKLHEFLRRGGKALIADDFGSAAPLLAQLGIKRHTAFIRARHRYADNPHLPIALPTRRGHPLTRGLRAVTTNHPAYFESALPTLLGFAGGRQQILVAGAVGKGRFVALSDPSVLINAMLRFKGNLTLATNILSQLGEGRSRGLLLTGHFQQGGLLPADEAKQRRAARAVNKLLHRVNDFALTAPMMRALAFVFGGLVLGAFLLVLPMPRRDLDGRWLRPGAQLLRLDPSGFAATQLREEVEQQLGEALDAPGPVSAIHPNWITERIRERFGAEASETCRKLLAALRHVPYAPDAGALGGTSRRELATLYELARELFLQLESERTLPSLSQATGERSAIDGHGR
ncbi:MAG: hypothetical protein CSA24_02600 [Deltaproteobacteria bacterium]|nr:MAG: hypothetical protein CSB49_01400 [Pseudomonadota bacterium]PIE65516.1 MAG: hypothetical protein CSA24_02600 [Deltaproteobacteria bacterium]